MTLASRSTLVALVLAAGCARDPSPQPVLTHIDPMTSPARAPVPSEVAAPSATAIAPAAAPKPALVRERYAWLDDKACPAAVEPLVARFDPPPGYARVKVEDGSFGAWLRGLPLTRPGTPVTSYRGEELRGGDDENIASVVAIDVGDGDLQQCADSVIRLHAEWLWSRGDRTMSYRAASGTAMPFARWARGERIQGKGLGIEWVLGGRAGADHASFRQYLDRVFAYANTGSLAQQAKPIDASEIRPGDFVVMPGGPGHSVLVLDMATREDGTRAVLLGQGYMPAQSFQVLRPSRQSAWFVIEAGATELKTPFWRPFPFSLLRRLDT